MSILEATEATGMSPNTLRRYIKRGRIKFRRLGKTSNSKLELWVTTNLIQTGAAERVTMDGFDDVLGDVAEVVDESFDPAVEGLVEGEYSGEGATRETLSWFRERLDDKDAKIDELMEKVEGLMDKLNSASYRNGYLESQVQTTQDQIKLLTDSQRQEKSWWARFSSWFLGKTSG